MVANVTMRSGDVELVCATWGAIDDRACPLVVCLHGFPDSAATWRFLGPELADAGFRVVAPWMRGYAPSSTAASGLYQPGALANDVIAIHERFGGDGGAVVGHDWGALAAYAASTGEPDRWSKVVGMAVPPGPVMGTALLTDRAQVKRSWYMFLFQHPLSDSIVAGDDLAFIDMLWADWSPGYEAGEDLDAVKRALREPANLSAALGYYRCALGAGPTDPALDELQAGAFGTLAHPALYLHGRDDGCVGADLAAAVGATAGTDVRVEIVDHAGHFLHLEQPAVVNAAILDFLT